MSTATKSPKSKKPVNRPAGLPDERFWIKYSQHHELPLSITSSLFIHALVLGFVGLVLAGILAGIFSKQRPPEVQSFAMEAGGGGDPNGSVESNGKAEINPGTESVKQVKQEAVPQLENKDLKTPVLTDAPLINPSDVVRVEGTQTLSPANLQDALKKAMARADAARSREKGLGGDGKGGGQGSGTGTGIGSKSGPGVEGHGSIKEARKARWTLLFSTSSPEDYLHQLRDLHAIIAVPEPNGKFLVFRDLGVRPLVGRVESGDELPKIQYSDNDQRTIAGFTHLLGLRRTPPYFMAFFSDDLEQQLRELERQKYSGSENNIIQTVFQFDRIGNGQYRPHVRDIRLMGQ
jgi:hypothetical protein